MIGNFEFNFPTRLVFGPGKIKELGKEAAKLGTKALLVTGKASLKKSGLFNRIAEDLKREGLSFVEYSGIGSNPTVQVADEAAAAAIKAKCDLVIGVGGGSVIDVAKIAALVARQGGSSWDYINTRERPARAIGSDVLPIIAVPTTAGTASESTPFAVITNPDIPMKKGIKSLYMYPRVSIIDPEIELSLSSEQTAWSGMDGFAQAIEGWVSKNAVPATELVAKEALSWINKGLVNAVRKGSDIEARAQVAWGVTLSGIAIGQIDVNLAHAMSHPLSARYDMHHGLAVAIMTPIAAEFNTEVAGNQFADVARVLGVYNPSLSVNSCATRVVDYLKDLLTEIQIPASLKPFGIPSGDIDVLAEDTLQIGAVKTNIRPVTKNDLVDLFSRLIK